MNTTPIGIAVLVAFTATFVGICVWAFWPGNRQTLKAHGLIPLNEDVDNG